MFDFNHEELRFRFGDLIVIYQKRKQYLLLGGIGTPGHGDHLRIEIPPSDADEAFDFRLHVTGRLPGGRVVRPFEMPLSLKQVTDFFERLAPFTNAAWRDATQLVDLDDLTERELVTVDASDEEVERFTRRLVKVRGRGQFSLDFSESMAKEWWDFFERNLTVPSLLDPDRARPGLYPIYRLDEETGVEQVGQLSHFPNGLSDGREPGWYLTDLQRLQQLSLEAFVEVGGEQILNVMRRINVALGRGSELSEQAEDLARRLLPGPATRASR